MECGTTLASGCPNCGFNNLPGAKFCSECGTVLQAGTQAAKPTSGALAQSQAASQQVAAPTEQASERRLVSILFADLVGFTPYAEERDSDDVRETLTRYFDLAREVIERYGGTVEKFIGDAVMAVWGAPVAQEDDAELAVRAGLDLVGAVTSLGPTIQARAGVLTGEASVTIGATNQGMVAGDLVNTASRLQSVAPPGTVLVGEATHRAASASIAFEPAGEQTLKGKQAPVAAWRALRVVSERGGRNRAETLEAPFVGRTDELRLLKDLLHATEREKKLRVVSIIGPAGIGKSRLAWELLKYIDGLAETIYWHNGRSPAYGEGITFWALGEMVRERAGLAELDDEPTTRAKVKEMVAQWVADESERDWIEPALLTLLGVEGGLAPDQLFGAWRTFFERIADNGPVALVFEDMHFADAGTLDFIDHLLDFSRGLPIYVVTLARPDLIERRQDWGAGKRNFVSLYLEPLSEQHMRELLAGLVPGMPESAVATVVARADGIPLYAVETIRSLVADGRLVEEDGVYVPKGDLTNLAVPETLTALIASRLDTLDETDRRVVHDGAVLGQSFTVEALAAVIEMPQADLEPRLAGLVRRELLRREMNPRSPERGQYEFVQALIREVAYNTLSKKDRKKLHLSAARYFESLGNDEIAGALASHYLAAHANSAEGAEADALAGQARIALKAAAARAAALGSFDQAVTFFEEALTVTSDTAERADLLEQAADASMGTSRYEPAEEFLVQALALRRELGDRAAIAQTEANLSNLEGLQFKVDEAIERTESALAEFADLTDVATLDALKINLARALFGRGGESRRVLELIDEALTSAERRNDLQLIERGLLMKANLMLEQGRRREGVGLTELVRKIALENGLTVELLRATNNLGGQAVDFDLRESLALYREGLALARRTGRRDFANQLVGNISYSGFLAGEWDETLSEIEPLLAAGNLEPRDSMLILNNFLLLHASRGESIEDGIAEMERIGKGMSGAQWHLFVSDPIANAGLSSGDLERAKTAFSAVGEEDASQASEYFYRATRAALWGRDLKEAERLGGLSLNAGGYGPVVDARRSTIRAGLAALGGNSAEALRFYRDALRDWQSSGAVWDEALTGIDMAELLDSSEPDISEVVASTRSILERLRAKPYIERLDAAVARDGFAAAPKTRAHAAIASEVAVAE
jgi:class 3 adenylate cyclase/tetratricopeptide (TPR) repeat protein